MLTKAILAARHKYRSSRSRTRYQREDQLLTGLASHSSVKPRSTAHCAGRLSGPCHLRGRLYCVSLFQSLLCWQHCVSTCAVYCCLFSLLFCWRLVLLCRRAGSAPKGMTKRTGFFFLFLLLSLLCSAAGVVTSHTCVNGSTYVVSVIECVVPHERVWFVCCCCVLWIALVVVVVVVLLFPFDYLFSLSLCLSFSL